MKFYSIGNDRYIVFGGTLFKEVGDIPAPQDGVSSSVPDDPKKKKRALHKALVKGDDTESKTDKIKRLKREGKTVEEISEAMGISGAGVSYHLNKQ